MISQRCPRCHSKRIRRGYRPTALWSKLMFRYNLLCDSCNWEFRGFAVPGTVSAKSNKRRKIDAKAKDEDVDDNSSSSTDDAGEISSASQKVKARF